MVGSDDSPIDPRKNVDIDTEKSRTLLNNMSLDCNDLRVLFIPKSEYDDMTNTDDEMTNKRMGRNVQKYLCLRIRSRERESMIVYYSKIEQSAMESSSPDPDCLPYSVCRGADESNPNFFCDTYSAP